jgi:hypothetical protein
MSKPPMTPRERIQRKIVRHFWKTTLDGIGDPKAMVDALAQFHSDAYEAGYKLGYSDAENDTRPTVTTFVETKRANSEPLPLKRDFPEYLAVGKRVWYQPHLGGHRYAGYIACKPWKNGGRWVVEVQGLDAAYRDAYGSDYVTNVGLGSLAERMFEPSEADESHLAPGEPVWYEPTVGMMKFAAVVDSAPFPTDGGRDRCVRLKNLDKDYSRYKVSGAKTVTHAAVSRVTRRLPGERKS